MMTPAERERLQQMAEARRKAHEAPKGFRQPFNCSQGNEDQMSLFNLDDLPEFSVTIPLTDENAASWFPAIEPKYVLIIDNGPNNPRAKTIIEGSENALKLSNGEPVDCDWYRSVGDKDSDEWEFVGRYPLKITYKK